MGLCAGLSLGGADFAMRVDVTNSKMLMLPANRAYLGRTFMNSRFVSNLAWTLGTCGLLWMAGIGTASAAIVPVPELDPGSAASGIALAVGAALLLAERYRRRA